MNGEDKDSSELGFSSGLAPVSSVCFGRSARFFDFELECRVTAVRDRLRQPLPAIPSAPAKRQEPPLLSANQSSSHNFYPPVQLQQEPQSQLFTAVQR